MVCRSAETRAAWSAVHSVGKLVCWKADQSDDRSAGLSVVPWAGTMVCLWADKLAVLLVASRVALWAVRTVVLMVGLTAAQSADRWVDL